MTTKMEQFPAKNPNPVLSVAKNGTVLYSNEAGEPLLNEWGVEVGDKLPSYIQDLVQKVISKNSPKKIEVKAGNRIYLVAFHPLPEENCVNIYGFDISDQKEFEEKLLESEEKYRQIVTTAREGIWTSDVQGITTFVNEIMADWLGYSVEELLGKSIFNSILKEDLDSFYERWRTREAGIKESYDLRLKKKDGSHIWVIVNVSPLRDAQGNFVGNLAMFSNITKRKQVEEALLQSEQHYRLLFETMLQGVVYQDADGKIIYMNPAAERILGKTQAEYLGSSSEGEEQDTIREDGSPFPGMEHPAMISLRTGQEVQNVVMGVYNPRENGYRWVNINAVPLFRTGENKPFQVYTLFDDITQRKCTEDAIKKSRFILAKSQEMAHLGNWAWNVQTGGMNGSDESYRIYGYEPGDVCLGEDWAMTRTHPDDRELLADFIHSVKRDGTRKSVDHRIVRRDGDTRYVMTVANKVVRDKAGKVKWVYGITQDITERKRAEEEVQGTSNMLQLIMNNIPQGIFWKDRNSRYMGCNEVFAKAAGVKSPENIIGKTDYDLPWSREQTEWFLEYDRRIMENDIPEYHIVEPQRKADGELAWVETNKIPLHDAKGNVIGILGTYEDITERKRAEEALKKARDTLEEKVKERTVELEDAYNSLKQSEKGLAEAQKIAHIGNWERNLVTGDLYWSDEMYRIFGRNPQEGAPDYTVLLNYMHPKDRNYMDKIIKRALNGDSYSTDHRIILHDGEERVVHVQAEVVFGERNIPVRIRGIVQDITERKKAEENLAKMEIARKKEIHHRIKNNLQVISSLLDLQAEQFKNKECIKDSEILEAFKESQDRVISMALIHEELYKGGGFETLNFSPYIEELAENLFHTYSIGNNLSLKLNLAENIFFDMDTAVPLGIIVNELVTNSLKHAFKGKDRGEIRIKLDREENGECVRSINKDCSNSFALTISDNGVGIPENLEIDKLDSLGLQLVTTLVDQLDGELGLKRNNNGTEFTIKFNVTEHNKTSAPAQQQLVD